MVMTSTPLPKPDPLLAQAVNEAMELRFPGRTINYVADEIGLYRATLSKLANGKRVSAETIEKAAVALGGDARQWRAWGGHPLPGPEEAPAGGGREGYELFVIGLAALCGELRRPIRISLNMETARRMTVKQAEETLAALRRQAEEGLF